MTFDYVIIPEKECILQRFTGRVSLKEVISCTELLWTDPRYDNTYCGISDLTSSIPDATPSDIPVLMAFLKRPEATRARWAAVFSEPKGTALAILFKMFPNPWFDIFSSWDSACHSLRLDIPISVFADGTTRHFS